MIQNYLKIAGRHLWRMRLYASINVAGMAVGITCILLATLYVLDEHGFDGFHTRNPNLYRITTSRIENGKRELTGGTGQVQGPAFQAAVPEVLNYARLMGGDIYGDVRTKGKAFRLQLLFVDQNFFDLFSFKLFRGNPKTVLNEVNAVVITEKTALKFFGRRDVVGETLQMDADPSARRIGKPLVVSGVVENPPLNSSVQFDILFPFRFMQISFDDKSWLNAYLGTFVLLHPESEPSKVEAKFNQIHKIHAQQQLAQHKKLTGTDPATIYGLQRMTDIHLNPKEVTSGSREGGVVNGSKPIYSYLFLGIAAFILLMASTNFINISISASLKRTKEVGVRKVTGSTRWQILGQFLGESVLLCFIAFLLSLVMTVLLLPVFNQFSGKDIILREILGLKLFVSVAFIFFVIVMAAGFYPAFRLSGLNPVDVLYRQSGGFKGGLFARCLVVFQFSVAVFLGIASLVFYQQMHFFRTKDLGYDPRQIVRISVPGLDDSKYVGENFKAQISNDSRFSGLSFAGEFGFRDAKINGRKIQSYYRTIDQDYVPLMHMPMKLGRNFEADNKYGVLVNEAFVKASGVKNPVGASLYADANFGDEPFKIIGVIKDFHHGSLRERIQPMVLLSSQQFGGDAIWAKINIDQQQQAIVILSESFKKLFPGAVFDYVFLDEQNAKEYAQESRWQKIIGYATLLSMIICCLGLFGIAHLTISQRTRETGIRVVLGAGVMDIVYMFSKEYFKMVLAAILIACPFAWYFMRIWLSSFVYHIKIEWWFFALSGFVALLVTVFTVGSQAVKAGRMNPVKAFYNGND